MALDALLNLAVAVLTGASAARLWLDRGDGAGWAEAHRQPLRHAAIAGVFVALAAHLARLWLASAAMAEVPLREAGPATWSMLTATHLGLAWSIGTGALLLAAVAIAQRAQGKGPALLTLMALAVFWYTRSMVSHAASEGDFSLPLLADWLHLGLVSLWVGEVIIAGGFILGGADALTAADRRARAAYVASLSSSASFALAGIFVTGLYASWRHLGRFGNLTATLYGNILVAKLLLVGVAAMLGGVNRFVVMPPWLANEAEGKAVPAILPARFRRILWIEAVVLASVIVLAAWLASTSPPGEAM